MTMKLKGAKELAEKLESLDWKVSRKLSGGTLKGQMEEVKSMMEAKAPLKTGNYKSNFKVTQSSSEKKKTVRVKIKNTAPHAHLVEFGHRIVTHDGKDTGKRAAANPTMRAVYKANKEKVVNSVIDEIRKALRSI